MDIEKKNNKNELEEETINNKSLNDLKDDKISERIENNLDNEVNIDSNIEDNVQEKNKDKEQILILEKKIEELETSEERLKAACADFANQLQSSREQMLNAIKYSNKRLIERFLFFLDTFEKAIEMGQNNSLDKNIIGKFLEGFEMTKTEFEKILLEQKVEKIKIVPFEDFFDPERHEVTSFKEDENYQNNVVIEVLRNGFTMHENVIRPALVVVNKIKVNKNNDL